METAIPFRAIEIDKDGLLIQVHYRDNYSRISFHKSLNDSLILNLFIEEPDYFFDLTANDSDEEIIDILVDTLSLFEKAIRFQIPPLIGDTIGSGIFCRVNGRRFYNYSESVTVIHYDVEFMI